MGKIRVKSFGDEETEKKQQAEAKKRIEAKKAVKKEEAVTEAVAPETVVATETPVEEKKAVKKEKFQKKKTVTHSKKYLEVVTLIEKNKHYKIADAVSLLPKLHIAKFDETVELHLNTTGAISGAITLPHGTGKTVRVAIADGSDAKTIDELVKKIESGTLDFDVLIATPDAMPKLARVARVLGPRGLMPNPKNGTVTPKPEEIAKKFAGGQMNYKTEAKAPILHVIVGKMSFGDKKLIENITVLLQTIQVKNIKNVTLKSTMSPGIKLDISSL